MLSLCRIWKGPNWNFICFNSYSIEKYSNDVIFIKLMERNRICNKCTAYIACRQYKESSFTTLLYLSTYFLKKSKLVRVLLFSQLICISYFITSVVLFYFLSFFSKYFFPFFAISHIIRMIDYFVNSLS